MSEEVSCYNAIRSALFENRTKEELIALINELFQSEFPLKSEIIVQERPEFMLFEGLMTLAQEDFVSDKVMLVFCSTESSQTKDCEGLRLFVKLKGKQEPKAGKRVIVFPTGCTLYANPSLPREGADQMSLSFQNAKVDNKALAPGEDVEIPVPFVNILAMDKGLFQKAPWYPLDDVYTTFSTTF